MSMTLFYYSLSDLHSSYCHIFLHHFSPHFSQWNYWGKKFFFLAFLTYGLNICVPQISNVEIITPQGADIRSWAFGRWWTWRGISALLTVAPKRSFCLFRCVRGYSKKWLSMNQETGYHQTLNLPEQIGTWTSEPHELWEISFYCF